MKRLEAAELGLSRYHSGKPCRAGHDSERYVSSGNCVACHVNVNKRVMQARIASGLGWPSVKTEVEREMVPLLRRVVSLLRYSGHESTQIRERLARGVDELAESLRDFHDVDCLEVVSGPARQMRAGPAPVLPELPDNGEPTDWHRDEEYKALVPAAFRGTAAP